MESLANHAALGGILLGALGFLIKYMIGGVGRQLEKLDTKMDTFSEHQAAISVKVAVLEAGADSTRGRVKELELWRSKNGSGR